MTISAQPGPLIIYGQNLAQGGSNASPDYNQDAGPSAVAGGFMKLDPRYGYRAPLAAGTLAAVGFFQNPPVLVVDQVPSTAATANLAALANVTSGTAMTLVAATGAGITVSTTALTLPASGVTTPVGTRFIDGAPGVITFSPNPSIVTYDPRTMLSRCLSITGVASGTGGAFLCRGADSFGFPVTEQITVGAGAVTANGQKGFKALYSVTPLFTDAHTYSVGTADIFEFPMQVLSFAAVGVTWNNGYIVANTGLVTASVTTPATATSGSVRGTYAVQSASDGTKRLQMEVQVPAQSIGAANGVASLFGVVNYSG